MSTYCISIHVGQGKLTCAEKELALNAKSASLAKLAGIKMKIQPKATKTLQRKTWPSFFKNKNNNKASHRTFERCSQSKNVQQRSYFATKEVCKKKIQCYAKGSEI